MLKIIFIVNSIQSKSGSERVAIELANKISMLDGYQVTLLNRDTNKYNSAYPISDNVNVVALNGSLFDFYLKLRRHISDNTYDHVVIHNMGKLSLLCAFVPNIKNMITLEHVSFLSRPKKIQFLSKLLYKFIDQVITLTESDKVLFNAFHNNVLVIPNFSPFPVNINRNNNSKEIVAIGRLTDQKNYIHLLKAWEKIYQEIPEWQLNIYGEGQHRQLLQDYIAQHSLHNVLLKGGTSDIKQVYEQSSFFVMSSKYEGLPMVLIEAQSFGLPIVSYDCPFGPSDIIRNHENGLLVEDQNIDELAEAILKLATTPDLLSKFSQNSLLNAQNYQPKQILQMWINKVFEG